MQWFKETPATYADWAGMPDDVGNYWGMAMATNRSTVFGGRILSTTGTCVRHLKATAFVGEVEDVAPDGFFRDLRAQRSNGYTSISFNAPSRNWGETAANFTWGTYATLFGMQRVMWARGTAGTGSADCSKPTRTGTMVAIVA